MRQGGALITQATFIDIPISPLTGTYYPYWGNTGYRNAPGYPGSLTRVDVTVSGNSSSPLASGTYNFQYFDCGSAAVSASPSSNSTFNGCLFAGSNGPVLDLSGNLGSSGNQANVTFNYCTFSPRTQDLPYPLYKAYQVSGRGGYDAWPTCDVWRSQPTGVENIPNVGNDYNLYMAGSQTVCPQFMINCGNNSGGIYSGPFTFSHCDFWGFGNCVEDMSSSQTTPLTFDRCWVHDARNDGNPGPPEPDHTDGLGDLTVGSPGQSYFTISNCTIASCGNTQGICMESVTGTVYDHNTFTGNYLTGWGYPADFWAGTTPNPTNLVITDNVWSTDNAQDFGWVSNAVPVTNGSTNLWRRNKFLVRNRHTSIPAGTYNGFPWTSADSGKYIYPNNSLNGSDLTTGP